MRSYNHYITLIFLNTYIYPVPILLQLIGEDGGRDSGASLIRGLKLLIDNAA